MPATVETYEAVLKDTWTQDRLEKQFHKGDEILDQIEKTERHKVGGKAVVPTHMGRSGGYTIVPPQGMTNLNGADKQRVDKARYDYSRHWFEASLDTGAIEKSESSLAVAGALDTEITGAIDDMRHQIAWQVYGDGTGFITRCQANSSTTTLKLNKVTGKWAIERGFLYPGLKIDIGVAATPSSLASKVTVESVDPDVSGDPVIEISGSGITTTTSSVISIAQSVDPVDGFYGLHGLKHLILDNEVGGLKTSDYFQWAGHHKDASGGALSLEMLLEMRKNIKSTAGERPDWNVCSPTQEVLFYLLLQHQVRFNSDGGIGAGDTDKVKWSGMTIDAQDDCPDDEWYMLTKKNLFAVRTDKPYWVTQKYGGSILQYLPNTTFLNGAAEYFIQLATNKRSALGLISGLKLTK